MSGYIATENEDGNPVHVDQAAELTGLPEKLVPVGADILLIEDSAAGFAKRKIAFGSFPSGVSLTAVVPTTIDPDDTGTAGIGSAAAREDHQHAVVTSAPVATGVANAEGVAAAFARADHVHESRGAPLLWGDGDVTATTTSRFLTPGFDSGSAQTSAIRYVATRAALLKNLRVRHNNPAGNGLAIVYTVRVNGAPSALTVSLASTSTSGSDLVNSVSIAADALVDIIVTKAASVGASPTDITASVEYV